MPTPRVPVALFLMILLPALLAAQAPRRRTARPAVGAEVGYSRSDLGGPDAQRVRSRQGALTGVFLLAPLAGPVSLRPEILFALKGGRAQASVEGGGTTELDIELAYIEMPLLLKLGVRRGRFRPMVFGGPAPRTADRLRSPGRRSDHPGPGPLRPDRAPAVPAVRHRRGGRRRTGGALAAVIARPRGPLHQRAPLRTRAGGCPEPVVRRGPRPHLLTARVQLT